MLNMLEMFEENVKNFPERIALRSVGEVTKSLTFREADEYSGRVYAWLKANGYGKEDFVMICLPRGIMTGVCVLGILKAGAAFVIVEDNYAPERISFIEKDCGCKLKIDAALLLEIMKTPPLSGHEQADPHDAAYAVYTSGTTGNPKGVLHEYGNISEYLESGNNEGKILIAPGDVFALIAPLNFIASAMTFFGTLSRGATMIILPYVITRDAKQLIRVLNAEMVTTMFMPAAYVRLYDNWSPYLKRVLFGSEPANGLSLNGVELYNVYGMSECGFDVCSFRIDHAYPQAPIGKPQFDKRVFLLDENGQPAEKGAMGELCVDDPYVRGYINLPEKTAQVFVDGVYHTGDLARMDENGLLTIVGRKDDMIKINGNRIEPAEIEACCRKVLGVRTVVAKGFSNTQRAWICLYYLNKEAAAAGLLDESGALKLSVDAIRKQLDRMLPYYMIPTYYVGLDALPLNPNGKLNKKALESPAADEFMEQYIAPTDPVQQKICDAFASVLGLERVGIRDDFYLIGGDSMNSIKMLSLCGLPGLSVMDLMQNHTAEKLARLYRDRYGDSGNDIAADNERALHQPQILLPEQINVVDNQFIRGKSTMWNLFSLVRLAADVRAEDFAAAVGKVIRSHPALLSVIRFATVGRREELVLEYHPELFRDVPVLDITEQELEEKKADLVRYYQLMNSLLYRAEIYRTEKASYFFFDVHHTLFDGTSYKVFLDDLEKALADPDAEPEKDYFYLELSREQQLRESSFLTETVSAYDKRFAGTDPEQLVVRPDRQTMARAYGSFHADLPADKAAVTASPLYRKLGGNTFFMTAMMLAVAEYNHSPKAAVQWIYNGRDEMTKQHITGLMYKTMPAIIDLSGDPALQDVCDDVLEQVRYGAAHNSCPYVYLSGMADANVPCFLYQNDMYSVFDRPCFNGLVELPEQKAASDASFELELIDNAKDDCFHVSIEYSAAAYREESVETVFSLFTKHVLRLMAEGGQH
ncbi:MAG: AMP-binding protein [Clostridia bacterium]|nr:AMP-binding protein [Clostridia bacterium]